MSLLRDVVFKKYPSWIMRFNQEKSKLNLKPINKLTIKFDPFNDDVTNIRKFSHVLFEEEIVRTNPKCIFKTEILTNRSDSQVIFDLVDGNKIIFKCANLKLLELLQLMNEHITPLAPKDDFTPQPVFKMKKKRQK